jgi:hypothetical protein
MINSINGVFKEIGFYDHPDKVGWLGWIRTKLGNYFIGFDGQIVGPFGGENSK